MKTYSVYGVIDGRFEVKVWARSEEDAKEKAERAIRSRIKGTPGLRLPRGDADLNVMALTANEVQGDKESSGVS